MIAQMLRKKREVAVSGAIASFPEPEVDEGQHFAKRSEAALAAFEAEEVGWGAKRSPGDCGMCGKAIRAKWDAKTLACSHMFHFACIDSFHRKQLFVEKRPDLQCYVCGASVTRTIAKTMEEKRRKREEERQREVAAALAEATQASGAGIESEPQADVAGSEPRDWRASMPSVSRRRGALSALAQAAQRSESS